MYRARRAFRIVRSRAHFQSFNLSSFRLSGSVGRRERYGSFARALGGVEAADFCAVWADECGLAAGDGDRAGGEAESVGGEEALLESVAAPEIPDLVRACAAPRAVVDGLARQRLDLGERGIARDWAAFERCLCERGRLGRGQVVGGIGRERGGAVGLPPGPGLPVDAI